MDLVIREMSEADDIFLGREVILMTKKLAAPSAK